jgi:cyclic pyranopterin phosphate synthase
MVVVRGLNDDEVVAMVRFAAEHDYHIRFIEFMPLDGVARWRREALVSAEEISARIEREFALVPLPPEGSPGDEYLLGAGPARVSLIATVSRPFCERCNRLRVTADGCLRACLFSTREYDLHPALGASHPTEALAAAFAEAVAGKPAGHQIGRGGFVRPQRSMFAIGG